MKKGDVTQNKVMIKAIQNTWMCYFCSPGTGSHTVHFADSKEHHEALQWEI